MLFSSLLLSVVGHIWTSRATPVAFSSPEDSPMILPMPDIPPTLPSEFSTDFAIILSGQISPVDAGYQQSTERVTDDIKQKYDVLYSKETRDGTYFNVVMGYEYISNPNFLPHPYIPDSWIVISQRNGLKYEIRHFAEFICVARFIPEEGALKCVTYPTILPVVTIPPTKHCEGDFQYMSFTDGPHDSRVFHGPQHPYTIFGAQSTHTCFGLWIQDLSSLVGPVNSDLFERPEFIRETELQRPGQYGYMEKNWFAFWDQYNNLHAHYDIAPYRSFARISHDGSAGNDLALASAKHDHKCMAKWMPSLDSKEESIHQATNSLAITLCNRADQACKENAETYIFHIFHWKTFNLPKFVGHYEPYIMVFKQTAPFELYGISKKPFWMYGRLLPGDPQLKNDRKLHEMLYVVSMSWKSKDQKYHGYLDDDLLIGFGIEDEKAAGMNVLAEDLFRNLGLCSEA